jgi:hypothetical protein
MLRPDEIVALRISQGKHFIGQAFNGAGRIFWILDFSLSFQP